MSNNSQLLNSQKIRIFEILTAAGLSADQFEWKIDESHHTKNGQISQLEKKSGEGFFFRFDRGRGLYVVTYSPAEKGRQDWHNDLSEDEMYREVTRWTEFLKRERESFDPWQTIPDASELFAAETASDDNTQFSEDEIKKIHQDLNELSIYMVDVAGLDPELVNARISYLEGAATRLGRKDWYLIFVGAIVNIVSNAYATPEITRDLLGFAGRIIRQIFQTQGLLL